VVGDSSLTRLGPHKETRRVCDPPAFCSCYSHRDMARRIFGRSFFRANSDGGVRLQRDDAGADMVARLVVSSVVGGGLDL
jgi:hypothetical protein